MPWTTSASSCTPSSLSSPTGRCRRRSSSPPPRLPDGATPAASPGSSAASRELWLHISGPSISAQTMLLYMATLLVCTMSKDLLTLPLIHIAGLLNYNLTSQMHIATWPMPLRKKDRLWRQRSVTIQPSASAQLMPTPSTIWPTSSGSKATSKKPLGYT